MTKEDIVAFLVKEYEIEETDATPAVENFMQNGFGFDDGSLEVSDVAEFVYSNTKYWKKEE